MIPIVILSIENDEDRAFMTDLYINYHLLMYHEIKKFVSSNWTADDLVNDVLINLIDKVALLKTLDAKRLASYIAITSKNVARNYIRKQRRTREVILSDIESSDSLKNDGVESIVLTNLMLEQLHNIWSQLSDDTQELLERKYILRESDSEIARAFQVKTSSIRMKLSRARKEALELLSNSKSTLN